MTLPASGLISIGMVAAELGIGLPLSLGDSRVRALAGVPSGTISLSNLYGKSGAAPLSATGSNASAFASSFSSPGTVSCAPSVMAGGGSGTITYLWEFTSNPGGCGLGNTTSSQCAVSHSYLKNASGSASATLRCTVRDGASGVVVVDNITADLSWDGNA